MNDVLEVVTVVLVAFKMAPALAHALAISRLGGTPQARTDNWPWP